VAAAKGRKLKVFQAPFGFYESVVAAPSQAAALRAWGSHQNLFSEGLAKLVTDEAAIKAALAHPETPLLRAVGSNDPFALEARSLPKLPNASKSAKGTNRKAKPEPRPPDRSGLDIAETAMRRLEQARKAEEEEYRRRRGRLDREEAEARAAYIAAKKKADAALEAERTAYRRAGGKD